MRTLNATVEAQLAAGRVSIRQLVKLSLGSGDYGFAMSVQPITFSGLEYKPLGVIEVSDLRLAPGTTADDFTVVLPASVEDGMLPAVLDGFFSEAFTDRPVSIIDAYLNVDTGALITGITMRSGYIDHVRLLRNVEGGSRFEIECTSRAIDYSRRNGRLSSDLDQRRRSSGDKFFEHTNQTGRTQLYWGRVKPS
jgi:hypothetical protein